MKKQSMSGFASGTLAAEVCFFVLMAGIVTPGWAAPTGSSEPLDGPALAATVPPLTGAAPSVDKPWGVADAAQLSARGTRAGPAGREPLSDLSGRLPEAPGRLTAMPASAMPLEENPRVDRIDAVASVLVSTAVAIPVLHLAPPPSTKSRAARGGTEFIDHAVRYDDGRPSSAGPSWAGEQGTSSGRRGDLVPQLSQEVIQFARELVANPLAWMLGMLAVMVAVSVSVFTKRGR